MKVMNKSRTGCLLIAFFSLTIILSISLNIFLVSGLGISPARKTVDFQPNTSVELGFTIINSEQSDFQAELRPLGELASIIFFKNQTVQVDSAEYRIPFKIILRFPSQMDPGVHTGRIEVNPVLPGIGENMFVAYIAPQVPITVRVPYPAKYLEVSFRALCVDEGTPVPLYVTLDNLGSEDIGEVLAEVKIYDSDNNLLESARTRKININNNSVREIQALPSPVLRKGLYHVIVKAYYDGLEKIIKANFTIGEPLIRIKELVTKELIKNEINKVLFKAYNEWNTELSVTGFLEINQRKTEMPVFRLRADEEREITAFFDTSGLRPGEYNMSIILIYADQIRTTTFLVSITKEIVVKPEKPRISPFLIGLFIIIIIIITVMVFFFIKKKKAFRERNL